MPIFGKKVQEIDGNKIYSGRASEVSTTRTDYSPYRTKSTKLLQRLRYTQNVYDAIDLLIEEHPDTSMGFSVLQSLVNQGGKLEFIGLSKRKTKEVQSEWRKFAERVNRVNSNGLDGLLVQLHGNDFRSGGMGCEIVVKEDLSDIEDIYPISGKELKWKLEEREGQKRWIPYQCVNAKEIDLSKANFVWIPYNPTNSPAGTLLFAPAISAADMQLEFLNSSQTVLYRVGCPRYNIEINREALMQSATQEVKQDRNKQIEYIQDAFDTTRAAFEKLSAENDLIHTDDTKVTVIGGESSSFFQGIGAFADIVDVQMMNAVKTLGTLMNRRSSGSYALSTVEFKVIVDMIEPRQRAEKRLVEEIARIWLRVHGIKADAKYTPNPIEWQTMLDKIEFQLKNQQFYRRSDEYGYISPDEAANKVNGVDGAYTVRDGLYEYLKKDLNVENSNTNTDESEGEQN